MTARFMGSLFPHTYRFQLGEFEISTILDGIGLRDAVKPPFCLNMDADDISNLARANQVPADRFEHQFVPTLVNTGEALVLIDVGFGPGGRESGTGQLRQRLAAAGYQPEDIDIVAFTHMHPDHILGVLEDGEPAYPNARYVMGQVEYDAWKSGREIPEARSKNRDMFLELIVPLAEQITFLQPGDDVVAGITAVEAFGHSLGHMMFHVESAGNSVLVWGDVANHYVFSLQVPEAVAAFDDDKDAAIATRLRVLDMAATDGQMIIGHHMPFPSIGFIERTKESYRWQPATYQMRI